jgi:hypothetical protein
MPQFEAEYSGRLSSKVSIRDTAGAEVAVISHGGFSRRYELLTDGQQITVRPYGFNWRKLEINSTADSLQVIGKYQSSHPFSITRGGMSTATVTPGRELAVEIADEENPVLMLAVALTVASIAEDHRRAQEAAG